MNKQEIERAIQALLLMKQPKGWDIICANGEWMGAVYDRAINALTAQLNNGWIPVSEKLPEKQRRFNTYVTMKHADGNHVFSDKVFWEYGEFKWFNGKKVSDKWIILAWMPERMPEPFTQSPK